MSIILPLAASCLLLLPASLRAQEGTGKAAQEQAAEELPQAEEAAPYPQAGEIVVTAKRGGVPLDYPGGRTVLEKEDLDRYPGASVFEVLRRVPGLNLGIESGDDTKPHIGIRGLNSRRSAYTTVLLDGVPLAPAPYGDTFLGIFPVTFERMDSVDFIRGGAAIRYGPNTVGGILNFHTAPIPSSPTGEAFVRLGSFGDNAEVASAGGTWDPLGLLVTGVHKSRDSFRDDSWSRIYDVAVKTRYALGPDSSLGASFSQYNERSSLEEGLSEAAYAADPDQSVREADFFGRRNSLTLDFTQQTGPESAFELLFYDNAVERDFDVEAPLLPPYTYVRSVHDNFQVPGLEARYFWKTRFLGVDHSLSHSARAVFEDYDADWFNTPIGGGARTVVSDANFGTRAYSFFTEDAIALLPSLTLAPGARFESIRMDSQSNVTGNRFDNDFDIFLPSATATWTGIPRTAVFASYQQSFRPPQFYTLDPSSAFFQKLDPEQARIYEAGVRTEDLDGFRGSVVGYWIGFEDEIAPVTLPSGVIVYQNQDRTAHRGVEIDATYDLSHAWQGLTGLSAYASLGLQKATIEVGANEGNDVPNVPGWTTAWGLAYDHPSGLWAGLEGNSVDESFTHPENFTTTVPNGTQGIQPSRTTWDSAVGWRQRPDGTGFQVKVGVTNLFDSDYFTRQPGATGGITPAPGRRFYVALGYALTF